MPDQFQVKTENEEKMQLNKLNEKKDNDFRMKLEKFEDNS